VRVQTEDRLAALRDALVDLVEDYKARGTVEEFEEVRTALFGIRHALDLLDWLVHEESRDAVVENIRIAQGIANDPARDPIMREVARKTVRDLQRVLLTVEGTR
jgi:hypothetical protein